MCGVEISDFKPKLALSFPPTSTAINNRTVTRLCPEVTFLSLIASINLLLANLTSPPEGALLQKVLCLLFLQRYWHHDGA